MTTPRCGCEAVGDEPGPVLEPIRIADYHVAAGVGTRVAQGVARGDNVGDQGIAWVALADVEARVGGTAGVGMVEHAKAGGEGIQAIVTVVVSRQVAAPEAVDAAPVKAVELVVARGHVLDRDTVGGEDSDAFVVGRLEVPVDDDFGAVFTPYGDAGGCDPDRLVVNAARNQHQVTGLGGVD